MGIVVGLDIGGSTTKIIGLKDKKLVGMTQVTASDPLASAYGSLGKFMEDQQIELSAIKHIQATGVGASSLRGKLLDVPTTIVSEFTSVGLGGTYVAGVDEAIVVSMGTGTSIVAARGDEVKHVIGSGVGGGTLMGLSRFVINAHDFDSITSLSVGGRLCNVDLSISDLTGGTLPGLPPNTTASNFGKVNDLTSREDLAAGILNLVFQAVGTMSVLASRLEGLNTIVFTGNLTESKQGAHMLEMFSTLYGVNMVIPEEGEFATAIGAALQAAQDY